MSDNNNNNDNNNINNIIPLFKREEIDDFMEEGLEWEDLVDVRLQDHAEHLDQFINWSREVTPHIEDLRREVEDLRRIVASLIRGLK